MKNPDTESLIQTGNSLIEEGNIPAAIQCYSRILAAEPDNADALLELGGLYGESGQIDEAMAAVQRSLTINPNNSTGWLTLAYLQQAAGDAGQAVESGNRAVSIEPGFFDAWMFLNGISGQIGNFEDAEKYIKRALEIEPGNPGALANYGNTLNQQKRYKEAVPILTAAYERDPGQCAALYGLVAALMSLFCIEDARQCLDRYTALCPDPEITLAGFGEHFLNAMNTEAAASMFGKLLERQPREPAAHLGMAKARILSGWEDDARIHLQKAIELDPGLDEARALLDWLDSGR